MGPNDFKSLQFEHLFEKIVCIKIEIAPRISCLFKYVHSGAKCLPRVWSVWCKMALAEVGVTLP